MTKVFTAKNIRKILRRNNAMKADRKVKKENQKVDPGFRKLPKEVDKAYLENAQTPKGGVKSTCLIDATGRILFWEIVSHK